MSRSVEAELLRHARSLRRLAAALVGDQHADDLVQATALAAVERQRALAAPPRALRAWLHRVVRHLAGKHRRAAARWQQHAPQLPARDPDADPTPALAAEHKELVQRLDEALLRLPEPYRATLLLRFHRDLSPAAIAAATGIPVATVKSRLQRGLALLRERLDANGRGDWRPALLAFALPHPLAAATALAVLPGVLLMTTTTKVTLAAAALLAAALWTLLPRAPEPSVELAGNPPAPADRVLAVDDHALAASGANATRRAVDGAAGGSANGSTEGGATEDGVTLRGRCVDEAGRPLAGVAVRVESFVRGSAADTAPPWSAPSPITSRADGTFALAFPTPVDRMLELQLDAQDRCPAEGRIQRFEQGMTIDVGDVTLVHGVRVQGRIVDASGSPVAGADIEIVHDRFAASRTPMVTSRARARVTSRADGSFGPTPPLPPGPGHLAASDLLLAEPRLPLALDAAHPLHEVLVTVPDPDSLASIRGRIVDDRDLPVDAAWVRHRYDSTRSGKDGTFRLFLRHPDNGPGPLRLVVAKNGFEDVETDPIAIGARDVTIRLPHTHSLVVRVLDHAHEPVSSFGVVVLTRREQGFLAERRVPVAPRGDGTLRVDDLEQAHSVPRWVWIVPADPTLAPPAPVPLQTDGDGVTTVTLLAARQRRLRIVDQAGSAVATAEVELVDTGGTELPITEGAIGGESGVNGDWPFTTKALLVQRGVTDADGEFLLAGPEDRALALRLSGAGLPPQTIQPVRLADAGPLVVVASRGATWRGRLTPPEIASELRPERAAGAPDARSSFGLVLSRQRLRLPPLLRPPFPIERDGTFELAGLPTGTWDVALQHEGMELPLGRIALHEGTVLDQDLDVSPLRPATLSLQVFVDGAPCQDSGVLLAIRHRMGTGGAASGSVRTRTDGAGRATVRCVPGVLAPSLFVADGKAGLAEVVLPTTIELGPGQQATHVLDVRLQQPTLRVLGPDGAPARGVVLTFANACDRTMATQPTDARGEVRAPRLVAGTYRVHVRFEDADVELPLTIPAMSAETIEVRLPRAAPR